MTRRAVRTASMEIFEKLKNSQEYRNGFSKQKYHIITRLLMIKNELAQFAQMPGREAYQVNGFLMEHCARFSSHLPKNTPKAQYISEVIINHLHDRELSNPDYIWLKIQGRHMTLTGIGEVKSHPVSMVHRRKQLFLQETNIRKLIACGEIADLVSRRYHITLADAFVRYLILPRGVDFPYFLPASVPLGWEIKEIEFTLPEIIFLKSLLCNEPPSSRKPHEHHSSYSPEEYESFVATLTAQIEAIIADLFENLLPDNKQEIRNALAIWSMIYNSIPANRESIDCAAQWIHAREQHRSSLIAKPPSSLIGFDTKKISSHPLMQYAANGHMPLARALLSRLQEIKQDLPDPPKLSCKQKINVFALL